MNHYRHIFLKKTKNDRYKLLYEKLEYNNLLISEKNESFNFPDKLKRIFNIFQIPVIEEYIKKYLKEKAKKYKNLDSMVLDVIGLGAGELLRKIADESTVEELSKVNPDDNNIINIYVNKLRDKVLETPDPKIKSNLM